MDDILQTTFSIICFMIFLILISLRLTPEGSIGYMVSIGSDNGLAPNRRQAITWTNDDPVHWRMYAPPGLSGLMWTFRILFIVPLTIRWVCGRLAGEIKRPWLKLLMQHWRIETHRNIVMRCCVWMMYRTDINIKSLPMATPHNDRYELLCLDIV